MLVLNDFRNNKFKILISTNIASRGLDIPKIKTILNYECAKTKDEHTHRIGRTGRAGDKTGQAFTLLLKNKQFKQAGKNYLALLSEIFEEIGQEIPPELEKMAQKDTEYRNSKKKIGTKLINIKVNINQDIDLLKGQILNYRSKAGIGFKEDQKKDDTSSRKKLTIKQTSKLLEKYKDDEYSFSDEDSPTENIKITMKNTFFSNFKKSDNLTTLNLKKKEVLHNKRNASKDENETRKTQWDVLPEEIVSKKDQS